MRTRQLGLLPLLLVACLPQERPPGGREGVMGELPPAMLIQDFLLQTPVVPCERWDGPGFVRSATPVGRENILTLAANGDSVSLLDAELRVLHTRRIPHGSHGPLDPVEAWVLGDSLLIVADARGRALYLSAWGEPHPTGERIPLPFIPHRLVPLAGGVGVVALGGPGGTLLHRWDRTGLAEVGIPAPSLEDPRLRLLAGTLVTTVSTSGESFLAHPLLVPLIYRVTGSQVERAPLPISDGQGEEVGRIPQPPFEEEEILGMLAPALDLAPGAGGSVLVLTRSGPLRGGVREKAVVQLNGRLEVKEAGRLPVNLVLLARQEAGGRVTGMDPSGAWHRCGPLVPLQAAFVGGPPRSRHSPDSGWPPPRGGTSHPDMVHES